MLQMTVSNIATQYVYFEVTQAGAVTKYYYFGGTRVALRTSAGVTYLHGDHLGSTSVTSGAQSSTQTYYAYGAVRTSDGTLQPAAESIRRLPMHEIGSSRFTRVARLSGLAPV